MKKIYLLAVIALITQASFAAELFIRVTRTGSHIATAFNQTQTNSTNIFRFFELPGGNLNVQITDQQTGTSIYSGFLNMSADQRVVAELDAFGTLKIIQSSTITTTNWYTSGPANNTVSTPVGTTYPNNGTTYPNNGGFNNNGNDAAFAQFLQMVENESIDSKRLEMTKSYVNKTNLSAQQIADISKKFTFDSNRLEWAKYAYSKCYDKANYFLLKNTFAFSSNYSALEDYIEGQ